MQPPPHTQMQLLAYIAILSVYIQAALATDLAANYSADFGFVLANSPYYVNHDVTFAATSKVSIANGVDIRFTGDYNLIMEGSINCGCDDIDTTAIISRGLVDSDTYVHFHSTDNQTKQGTVVISNTATVTDEVKFCNSKFEFMTVGVDFTSSNSISDALVDNCMFSGFEKYQFGAINVDTSGVFITDSLFVDNEMDVSCETYGVATNLHIINNRFEEATRWGTEEIISAYDCGGGLRIANNTIINNGKDSFIYTSSRTTTIEYNEFINNTWKTGIFGTPTGGGTVYIDHNVFKNNIIQSTSETFGGLLNSAIHFLYFRHNVVDNVHQKMPWLISKDNKQGNYYIQNNVFKNIRFDTGRVPSGGSIAFLQVHVFYIDENVFYASAGDNINAYLDLSAQFNGYSTIQYNNFYDSENINYFVRMLPDNKRDVNGEFNYFDGFDNINNISSRIYDYCENSAAGIVAFWPWLTTAYLDGDVYSGTQCGINATFNCNYTDAVQCDGVMITAPPTTSEPTMYPTGVPSTSAPSSHTLAPSVGTLSPTSVPSSAPSTPSTQTLAPSIETLSPSVATMRPSDSPTTAYPTEITVDPTTAQPTDATPSPTTRSPTTNEPTEAPSVVITVDDSPADASYFRALMSIIVTTVFVLSL